MRSQSRSPVQGQAGIKEENIEHEESKSDRESKYVATHPPTPSCQNNSDNPTSRVISHTIYQPEKGRKEISYEALEDGTGKVGTKQKKEC